MSKKKIIILGATGSIGSSTINIVRENPHEFEIVGISAHSNTKALQEISSEFSVKNEILSSHQGQEKLLEMIRNTEADIVVNGIAGSSGLLPSKAALDSGKDLALANKETIVMAGRLIKSEAKKLGKKILPVDSEHSAIFTLEQMFTKESIDEVILTASGGPFRTYSSEKLQKVTVEDALRHPTWQMGTKITIDSATLANKGLEVIEACILFDIVPQKVRVVVHPQSIVHSCIRTNDGVIYAQLSKPDMRHPIISALRWPQFSQNTLEKLDFSKPLDLHFEPPRLNDFPLLSLAYKCVSLGGAYTIAYNAANEIAVSSFVHKQISFSTIATVVTEVLNDNWTQECDSFEAVCDFDSQARISAHNAIKRQQK